MPAKRREPEALVLADTAPPFDDDIPYPLFPRLDAGRIDGVRVFRLLPRRDGKQGHHWLAVELPWQPTTVTWDLVRQICGGGEFVVQAVAGGQPITSVRNSFDGPPRKPVPSDVGIVAPELLVDADGTAVVETKNGWLALSGPGISPGIQAAFLIGQQMAHYARADAASARESEAKAYAANAILMGSMSAKFTQPDPAVAVLLEQMSALRDRMDLMAKENLDLRNENTRYRIDASKDKNERVQLDNELKQRGLNIIDSVGGAVLQNMMGKSAEAAGNAAGAAAAKTVSGAADALAASIAKRIKPT